MGDTFGGEWKRPRNDGRGHSKREVQDRASFDSDKSTDCLSSLFLLSVLATTAVAALRKGRTT
jgi:hypothetical protein